MPPTSGENQSQEITSRLVSQYFEHHPPQQKDQLSSHWEQWSQTAWVKRLPDGTIVDIGGEGFGVRKWGTWKRSILDKICIGLHFLFLPSKVDRWIIWRVAKEVCREMNLSPSMDVFRQASALSLLLQMAPIMRGETDFRVLVIGDGFGVLAALIKAIRPQARLTLVDIGKTLAIQSFFLGKTYPEARHSLLESGSTPDNVDFLYVPAEQAQCLAEFRYELAINIGSMQEMTPAIVSDYFNLFRECLVKDNRFYCCNRERKVLPGGEVLAIREYPWRPEDEILLDESSPWDRYFLGWTPTQRGPTIGEWRIPLVNSPDGEVIHRLAIMKTKEAA